MDEVSKLKLRIEQMETRMRALEREARDREYRHNRDIKVLEDKIKNHS